MAAITAWPRYPEMPVVISGQRMRSCAATGCCRTHLIPRSMTPLPGLCEAETYYYTSVALTAHRLYDVSCSAERLRMTAAP
jgi:hypothetical protein